MKIILIRNFTPDGQESMLRFAECVAQGLDAANVPHTTIEPRLRWGKILGSYRYDGLPKWFGYLDKFFLFPREIKRTISQCQQSGESPVVHLLDHGNAGYVPPSASIPWLVTCNDLLAVKAARGDQNGIHVSRAGRFLQDRVMRGLNRASHVACISHATQRDLIELIPSRDSSSSVVHMGLNHPLSLIHI